MEHKPTPVISNSFSITLQRMDKTCITNIRLPNAYEHATIVRYDGVLFVWRGGTLFIEEHMYDFDQTDLPVPAPVYAQKSDPYYRG